MSVSLTVMTFNLLEDQAEDSPNSWEKRRDLCISVITSYSPMILCTQQGHSDMVWYLYQKTKSKDLSDEDRIGILNTCVSTDLYDVALDILKHNPQLAVARDGNGETALHVLARKPSAFTGGSQVSMWKRFINTFPGRKVGHDKSLKQAQAFELVRLLWKMVIKQYDSEISDLI
ncbi:hypothetical protein CsSME_00031888 [Camellia sinensis var. sinensis]